MKEEKEKTIFIIGTDASGFNSLPSITQELILSSTSIATPKRLLSSFKDWLCKHNINIDSINLFSSEKPKELVRWLKGCNADSIVIASGDPLWFGIGRILTESFPKDKLIFYPGKTCMQLAFTKLKRPWQNASWISIHGRDPEILIEKLRKHPEELLILVDPKRGGAKEVRNILNGICLLESYEFWIFEKLGHEKERFFQVNPNDSIGELDPLHLVLLIAKQKSSPKPESLPIIGIPDDNFINYQDRPGLITKKEVRVQLLAELNLPEEGILWDIGAGVGSIGLEAIRLRPKVKLLSIDKRVGSKNLIDQNSSRLGVKPSLVLEGNVIKLLNENCIPDNLSSPDRIIIGGGGSMRLDIINSMIDRVKIKGIIIIPLATIEAVGEIKSSLKMMNIFISISQHQSWRGIPLAEGTRLSPLNPVFIVKIIKL